MCAAFNSFAGSKQKEQEEEARNGMSIEHLQFIQPFQRS